MGFAHGGLNEQRFDVLPVLLEQRDEEVDGQHDVTEQLVLGHTDVADSDTQAEHLLELELDGGAQLVGLGNQIVSVGDGGGELTGLMETRTQQTRNLLNESLGSKEGIVLLRKLLYQLLVLVELLEVINGHELKAGGLSLVAMEGITKNTHGHLGAGNVGELDGTRETLITLGIIVLETDLELDGLGELPLLLLGGNLNGADGFSHGGNADLTTHDWRRVKWMT